MGALLSFACSTQAVVASPLPMLLFAGFIFLFLLNLFFAVAL
jgi:hypothetical protein